MLYVAWKRGLPQKFAHFVLFRLIKKRSFNLLCVLDLFSECWQSTLFQIFLYMGELVSTNMPRSLTELENGRFNSSTRMESTDSSACCTLFFVVLVLHGLYLSSNHFHFVCIISSMIFISWQHFPRFRKSETAGASSGWKPSYQQQSPAKSEQPMFYAVLFEFGVTLTGNLISMNKCVGVFNTMPPHSSSVFVIWHQIWLIEPSTTILMNIHEVDDKGNPHRKWGWNAGLHCSQQNGQALPVKTCKSHVYQHNCSLLHFLNSMNNSDNNKIPSHSFPFLGKKKEKKGQVNQDSVWEDTTVHTEVGNRIDCGEDVLASDLMTSWKCPCTTLFLILWLAVTCLIKSGPLCSYSDRWDQEWAICTTHPAPGPLTASAVSTCTLPTWWTLAASGHCTTFHTGSRFVSSHIIR